MVLPIGNQLREARLQRGLTLEDVAHRTKIPVRNLENLEAGKFEDFSSPAYARGFLRNYGTYLEIDTSDALAAIQAPSSKKRNGHHLQSPALRPSETVIPIVKHRVERVPQRSTFTPVLLVIFALAIPSVYLLGKRVALEEISSFRSDAGPTVLAPETVETPTPATVIEGSSAQQPPASEVRYPTEPSSRPQPSPELDALIGLDPDAGP